MSIQCTREITIGKKIHIVNIYIVPSASVALYKAQYCNSYIRQCDIEIVYEIHEVATLPILTSYKEQVQEVRGRMGQAEALLDTGWGLFRPGYALVGRGKFSLSV